MPWILFSKLTRAAAKRPTDPTIPSSAPVTASKLGIGSVVRQRYRLDAEIGRGGIGIVYRAFDMAYARQVAFKVLNVETSNALTRDQFLQEARIASSLDHPNIIHVYDMGTLNDHAESPPFLVMEFVPGRNLSELRGITIRQSLELGQQICAALEYIHSRGIVHRDVKPQNVLVEQRGLRYAAKLGDLGLARPRNAAREASEGVAGTVYYIAPEVIAGKPADVAADLYALGAMLYEMITGRVPFSDYDEQTVLSQHLNESAVPLSQSRPDTPPALEAIILRLLAKNPKARFASAHQVCDALKQVASGLAHSSVGSGNLPPVSAGTLTPADEIAQVKTLVESHRLVTILGTPTPKRRHLVLATGAELTEEFLDGVWLVELEPLSDPAMVPQAVATVLGIHPEPARSLVVSLIENLRERNLLLLFEHCDVSVGACAQLAETVLRACPEVRILATSRQPFKISEEQTHMAGA